MKRNKTDKAERKFAEIITAAHRKSGLSNKEFAALCGTSTVQLWRWENGHRVPTIGAARYADTKGCQAAMAR